MVPWKLIVEDYGKIRHAEIETAPLTLFVGDNNSGKSYLLSLLWGIQNSGIADLLDLDELKTEGYPVLKSWILKQLHVAMEKKEYEVTLAEVSGLLLPILNEGLKLHKNKLVQRIFNSQDVKISHMAIVMEEKDISKEKVYFQVKETEKSRWSGGGEKCCFIFGKDINTFYDNEFSDDLVNICIYGIYSYLLGIKIVEDAKNSDIYLPAARTGFMLTKDIINKVGRENTFNLLEEKKQITPFTRPINQFLDVMGDLTSEGRGNESGIKIVSTMESEMAEGAVEISSLPGKEVLYTPKGKKKGMPLRIVSAVVTELSPLMLILKHKPSIGGLYYEEPEMCLHPQLQQKMGKIIGRIVNSGIDMVITTHSDIILQHVNNMIKLAAHPDREEMFRRFDYSQNDVLNSNQVRVYQFITDSKMRTEVVGLPK